MNIFLTKFRLFNDISNLTQAFSTRQGGFSREPYTGLNLGMHTNDNLSDIRKNRQLFFKHLNVSPNQLVFPEQVHSDNVQIVQEPGIVKDCDALITNQRNLFLTIQTADCFPVFFYEPQQEVVALVHSGWKGTAKNIAAKTIQLMVNNFSCRPQKILAGIGPGVQQSCYQVDQPVAEFFEKRFLIPDGNAHFKLDVQGAIYHQLLQEGLTDENIERDTACTHCASDLYYSYRRDGINSGRMMGVIGLRL